MSLKTFICKSSAAEFLHSDNEPLRHSVRCLLPNRDLERRYIPLFIHSEPCHNDHLSLRGCVYLTTTRSSNFAKGCITIFYGRYQDQRPSRVLASAVGLPQERHYGPDQPLQG